ncbi:hypothetical protein ABT255_32665 [Streptomyces mirabilis]|uniref:hypothetical protein n=1 Tax=Streptomyces mirabilis TaxID=68239 RepID=UPI00331CE719
MDQRYGRPRVKIVTQVKLMPEVEQAAALRSTLRTVNDLACWVSEVAFAHGVPREYELRKHTYSPLKAEGLGAQSAQHTIKKVRDAYTSSKDRNRAPDRLHQERRDAYRHTSKRSIKYGQSRSSKIVGYQ